MLHTSYKQNAVGEENEWLVYERLIDSLLIYLAIYSFSTKLFCLNQKINFPSGPSQSHISI